MSESGLHGQPGQLNYSAAKGAILSLTLVLARELRKYGVTANCIAPRAKTRMTATMDIAGEFMTGPEWDPENIAPMVVFLASDAAADVSGQVFVVFGPNVYLMEGWQMVSELHHENDARWTPEELIARKDELFAGRSAARFRPWASGSSRMPPKGPLLVDQLRFMAEAHGDDNGYEDLDAREAITFRQWDERSNQVARWLTAHGVGKGDRVSIYLPSEYCLQWIVAYAGIHKAGAVCVPTEHAALGARARGDPRARGDLGDGDGRADARRTSKRCAAASRRSRAILEPRRRGSVECRSVERGRRSTSSTAARRRFRSRVTTSPTSCTRRARPDCRRVSSSATATSR